MILYGIECPCHGTRLYRTMRERDAHAITFQCEVKLFRVNTQNTDTRNEQRDGEK